LNPTLGGETPRTVDVLTTGGWTRSGTVAVENVAVEADGD
jgi:hypothetical protein